MPALTEDQLSQLKTALKRCDEATLQAAIAYREHGDVSVIPVIVTGIIARFMPPENTDKIRSAGDETRLAEDLGIDSLTMLEVVMTIEEVLSMRIEDAELRDIRTMGDVKKFIALKVAGGSAADADGAVAAKKQNYDRERLHLVLPQQHPFLFLSEARIEGEVTRASYHFSGQEQFFEGHFANDPTVPAAIVFEAVGQAACLYLLEVIVPKEKAPAGGKTLFVSLEGAHFYRKAVPGDTIEIEVKPVRERLPLSVFNATVTLRGEKLATVERLTLAYGDVDAAALVEGEQVKGAASSATVAGNV
jgi:3-hydroxyacyl-[acyl-carrier-protein] dehydratase